MSYDQYRAALVWPPRSLQQRRRDRRRACLRTGLILFSQGFRRLLRTLRRTYQNSRVLWQALRQPLGNPPRLLLALGSQLARFVGNPILGVGMTPQYQIHVPCSTFRVPGSKFNVQL